MRQRAHGLALIFGLSMSGLLAAVAALAARILMLALGLDLLLRVLGG
jgi:hypothetical protein